MRKKSKIIKIILAYFVFQFIISMAFAVYDSMQYEVSEYATSADIIVGDVQIVHIGREYGLCVAKDGYTLYEVAVPMTNQSCASYTILDKYVYSVQEEKASSSGLKGNLSSDAAYIVDEAECSIVYSNCPERDGEAYELFGWEALTVIPGKCTIIYRDIVEVPEAATEMTIDYGVFGEDAVVTLP